MRWSTFVVTTLFPHMTCSSQIKSWLYWGLSFLSKFPRKLHFLAPHPPCLTTIKSLSKEAPHFNLFKGHRTQQSNFFFFRVWTLALEEVVNQFYTGRSLYPGRALIRWCCFARNIKQTMLIQNFSWVLVVKWQCITNQTNHKGMWFYGSCVWIFRSWGMFYQTHLVIYCHLVFVNGRCL